MIDDGASITIHLLPFARFVCYAFLDFLSIELHTPSSISKCG